QSKHNPLNSVKAHHLLLGGIDRKCRSAETRQRSGRTPKSVECSRRLVFRASVMECGQSSAALIAFSALPSHSPAFHTTPPAFAFCSEAVSVSRERGFRETLLTRQHSSPETLTADTAP